MNAVATHPRFWGELRKMRGQLLALAAIMLFLLWVEVPESLRGIAGYEPLHSLLEIFAIVVSGLIFATAWNAQAHKASGSLLLLAYTFLGVALLDFSHLMSFKGMPDYVTPSDPEKAINFWLAARLLAAVSLLLVAALPWKPLRQPMHRYLLLLGVMSFVGLAHVLFLFYPTAIPRTFIAGTGLTALKVHMEYGLIGLHLLAAGFLIWRQQSALGPHATGLLGAVLTMAMSELFFTMYANVADLFNLAGHVYKVIAYQFLYQSIFVATVQRPYQALDAVQNSLKATLDAIPDMVFEMELNGTYYSYHTPQIDQLGIPVSTLIGKNVRDVMPEASTNTVLAALQEAMDKGRSSGYLVKLRLRDGWRWFELSAARKAVEGNAEPRIIVLTRDITERMESEQQLKLLGTAMADLNDIVLITEAEPLQDEGPRIVFVNDAFERRTGYTREEVLGKTPRILQGPHTDREVLNQIRQRLKQWKPIHAELINYSKSGEEFWVELTIAPIADSTGWFTHWVSVQRDVTERVLAKNALQASLQHTQAILDNMADGVVTIGPDGLVRTFNKAASAMFGYTAEEVVGHNVSLLMPEPHRSQHDSYLEHYRSTGEERILGKPRELEGKRKDGSTFPLSLSVSQTSHLGQATFIGLVRDITQRRSDEEEIRRLAFYDGLTGLPNRRLLADHLRHALAASSRSGLYGAVMFLDLDHFKQVNDTRGHPVGDDLLRQVAARLQMAVREGDTVARLGGDEFVLVLENLSAHHHEAAARAEVVANKVLQLLAEPCRLQGKPHVATTSVGIALFIENSKSYDDLLKEADAALYQAKAAGRNTFCFFDPAMQAKAVERSQMEEEIRGGLSRHEFVLFYQLQVDRQGNSLGVEALIRWQHPQRGLVSPAHFIPLAEETGLILPLGQWVLETACQQLAHWANDPEAAHLTIAVNVSAAQFAQTDFVAKVEHALTLSKAPPERLKLELTESTLAANVEDLVLKMTALRQRGVSFSLDDFGTGYSSLAYLKRLPLQQLKIDQGFVRDLLTDPNDATIASTIVSLGHSLGLKVIAEGVENEGQRQALAGMGCDAYQGYYFGKPVPAKDLQAGLLHTRVPA